MKLGRPYQNPKTDVEIVKDLLSYSEKRYDPNSLNVFINNY
jgi:response regulator RpfG family c-di-GMP phosphodiesterase